MTDPTSKFLEFLLTCLTNKSLQLQQSVETRMSTEETPLLLLCGTTTEVSTEHRDVLRSLASVLKSSYYHNHVVVSVATTVADVLAEMIAVNASQKKLEKLSHAQIVALCCDTIAKLPSKSVVVSVWFSDEEDYAESISVCCVDKNLGCITLILPGQ